MEATSFDYTFDFITDTGAHDVNEDSFVAEKKTGIFAVFDGATSLNAFSGKDGKTGAYLASNIAKTVFKKDKKSLVDLAFDANLEIRKAMQKENINIGDKLNLWGTTVAAIKINKGSFDWIQLSDTIILIIYKNNFHRLLVDEYDHDKETLAIMKKLIENGSKNPRADIAKQLEVLRRNLNITHGLIAGESDIRFLCKGTESLDDVKHILIFSDGMLIPKADPYQKDDFDTIVKEYKKGGLNRWLKYIRNLEDGDPNLKKYIRYKIHDDATALALSFE